MGISPMRPAAAFPIVDGARPADDATMSRRDDVTAMDQLDAAAERLHDDGLVGMDPAGLDGIRVPQFGAEAGLGSIGEPYRLSPDTFDSMTHPKGALPGPDSGQAFGLRGVSELRRDVRP